MASLGLPDPKLLLRQERTGTPRLPLTLASTVPERNRTQVGALGVRVQQTLALAPTELCPSPRARARSECVARGCR